MNIQTAINHAVGGNSLSADDMQTVMMQIMTGEATPAQIAGFLVALRIKGETIDEIVGAAKVMRELSTKVSVNKPHMVDTCGTGGDGSHLFNVSTASAFVAAAAGATVAKHGNRSVTSSTGSADVLEAAGVNLGITAEQVGRCIEEVGVGFMFAVAHHGSMKHAIGPRKELGLRTIFNVLGPLTNPAGVKNQVLGVFDQALCRPLAEVLQRLGSEHVLVVHAADGLDELSLASVTHIAELKDGAIAEYSLSPEDVGLTTQSLEGLSVTSAEESLALIKSIFNCESDARTQVASDMVALNGGAAIYVSGVAATLREGVALAQDAIGSGLAGGKLSELVEFSNCF